MNNREAGCLWLVSDKDLFDSVQPTIWRTPDIAEQHLQNITGLVVVGIYYHHESIVGNPHLVDPERIILRALITTLATTGQVYEVYESDILKARTMLNAEAGRSAHLHEVFNYIHTISKDSAGADRVNTPSYIRHLEHPRADVPQ